MVLSCVWCVVGIGARAHQEREGYILRPRKFVRMRVRVRIRVHVTGEVLARGHTCVGRLNEQPHWRWPKQGAAVAEQGGLGELSGLCKAYRPKRRPAEGAVLFRPIMWLYSASVVLGSTLHLALAIFQQGIPCPGYRPKTFLICEFGGGGSFSYWYVGYLAFFSFVFPSQPESTSVMTAAA